MAGLLNNPHYKNGVYIGTQVAKHIESTTYGTLEVAITRKEELIKDLKEQFGWDENNPEVAEILGIIESLKEELKRKSKGEDLEHGISIDDVSEVALSIGKTVTEEQAQLILDRYTNAQEDDPGATWNLVIENLIYEVENEN